MIGSTERHVRSSSRLFLIVCFSIVLYVVLDTLVQILPPHYSAISQPESDLAVGPYGYIMTVNFLIRGIFSVMFVFAITSSLDMARLRRSKIRSGVYATLVWAIGSILLAIFPTDASASAPTWHGAIHLVVAIISFIAGALGSFMISRNLPSKGPFIRIRNSAQILSFLVLLFLIIDLALPLALPHLNAKIGGVTERFFLGSLLLWIGVVSAYFVRLNNSQEIRVYQE